MPFSISKLMEAIGDNKPREVLNEGNPEIPNRYNKLKGMQVPNNTNHNFSPYDFDHYNEIMKQSGAKRYDMSGLHLDLKQKKGTEPIFQETEGWIDPAQRRRAYDPNHAPPFDFVNGAAFQKFGTEPSENVAHDNVSLIQTAHKNYNNYINRYNVPSIPVTIQK